MEKFRSVLSSIVAIFICGGLGGLLSNGIITALGWHGIFAAVATIVLSLLLAFSFFAAGAVALNIFRSDHKHQ